MVSLSFLGAVVALRGVSNTPTASGNFCARQASINVKQRKQASWREVEYRGGTNIRKKREE